MARRSASGGVAVAAGSPVARLASLVLVQLVRSQTFLSPSVTPQQLAPEVVPEDANPRKGAAPAWSFEGWAPEETTAAAEVPIVAVESGTLVSPLDAPAATAAAASQTDTVTEEAAVHDADLAEATAATQPNAVAAPTVMGTIEQDEPPFEMRVPAAAVAMESEALVAPLDTPAATVAAVSPAYTAAEEAAVREADLVDAEAATQPNAAALALTGATEQGEPPFDMLVPAAVDAMESETHVSPLDTRASTVAAVSPANTAAEKAAVREADLAAAEAATQPDVLAAPTVMGTIGQDEPPFEMRVPAAAVAMESETHVSPLDTRAGTAAVREADLAEAEAASQQDAVAAPTGMGTIAQDEPTFEMQAPTAEPAAAASAPAAVAVPEKTAAAAKGRGTADSATSVATAVAAPAHIEQDHSSDDPPAGTNDATGAVAGAAADSVPPPPQKADDELATLLDAQAKAAAAKKAAIDQQLQQTMQMAQAQAVAVNAAKQIEAQAWAIANNVAEMHRSAVANETERQMNFINNITSANDALESASKRAIEERLARQQAEIMANQAEEKLKALRTQVVNENLMRAKRDAFTAGAQAQRAQDAPIAANLSNILQQALAQSVAGSNLRAQVDVAASNAGAYMAAFASKYPANTTHGDVIKQALDDAARATAVITNATRHGYPVANP